ncbi:hypothetical protein GCM10027565_13420 [Bordetella tumulicola]
MPPHPAHVILNPQLHASYGKAARQTAFCDMPHWQFAQTVYQYRFRIRFQPDAAVADLNCHMARSNSFIPYDEIAIEIGPKAIFDIFMDARPGSCMHAACYMQCK